MAEATMEKAVMEEVMMVVKAKAEAEPDRERSKSCVRI
jgi:hypothetical protein